MLEMRQDFSLRDGGGYLMVATRDLGGLSASAFARRMFDNSSALELVTAGVAIPTAFIEQNNYSVRCVLGSLNAQEEAEWLATVCWRLNIASGEVLISSVLSQDYFAEDFAGMPLATQRTNYQLGCYLNVPPGEYQVDLYSYAPCDYTGAWLAITGPALEPEFYQAVDGIEPELPLDWFRRTHGDNRPPKWIEQDVIDRGYISIVVKLTPLTESLSLPRWNEYNQHFEWTYRKPAICPLGLLY